ncbi:hypothetical protein [Sorangium sp. So ce887]|uniref:hypothetical protein n=1 Tax=Sorangium sp. So ce887 TaxID=3133324 RepID=UPI003F5E5A35
MDSNDDGIRSENKEPTDVERVSRIRSMFLEVAEMFLQQARDSSDGKSLDCAIRAWEAASD